MNDKLRTDLAQVMEWFNEKYMVLNADKWHYKCLGKDTENLKFHFDGNTVKPPKADILYSGHTMNSRQNV